VDPASPPRSDESQHAVDPWLTLSADRPVAQNHLIVRKRGVTLVTPDEIIRKQP
jgi:hypothetical protein